MKAVTSASASEDVELDSWQLPQTYDAAWFRIVQKSSGSLELTNAKFESEIIDRLSKWHEKFSFATTTLGGVVDSLKKSLDYNGLYNSFLLGQISEDEFTTDAANFIVESSGDGRDVLLQKIGILLKYTKCEFTTSELSDIFRTDDETVDQIVHQLHLKLDHTEQALLPFVEN